MNRRKFLATVGTMVASTGALLGTGAFTTVSAERSFSVSAADDSAALLEIVVGPGREADEIADNSSGTVEIDFNKINRNAYSAFDGIIRIRNNSDAGSTNELGVKSLTFIAEDDSGNEISEDVLKVYSTGGDVAETAPLDDNFNLKSGINDKISRTDFEGNRLSPGGYVDIGFLIDTTVASKSDVNDIENVIVAAETPDSGT